MVLDSNWLMAIFTGIYVLLTYFILKSNKKMIEETIVTRKLSNRPEVIAFFREEQGGIYFQIKNIGTRLALATTIRIEPGFNEYTYLHEKDFMQVYPGQYVEKKIKVLAPGQILETFVQINQEINKVYNESIKNHTGNSKSFESGVKVWYEDNEKEKYYVEYDVTLLDYNSHKGIITYDTHDLVKELKEINKKMDINNFSTS